MKKMLAFAMMSVLLSLLTGCASTGGKMTEARIAPPPAMDRIYAQYKELPGNKVFVVAADADGRWAYGYDSGRETVEEAARNAAAQCDAMRKNAKVLARPKLFAINNKVVYYNQFK